MRLWRSSMMVLLATAALAVPAAAQVTVDKTVPFELDKWYELGAKEGPVLLHRIHLERQGGPGLKARVAHGADEEWTASVKVELEYSNASSTDWKGVVRLTWLDDNGEAIDGYNGRHQLDEKTDFGRVSGTVTTLRYGLAHARKLRLLINVRPE
jgi:hypothetical protein